MAFDVNQIDILLPNSIAEQKKGRLKEALSQFKVKSNSHKDLAQNLGQIENSNSFKEWSPKLYTSFYTTKQAPYFMQGDVIRDVRFPLWNSETMMYEKGYLDAVVITNTCDMDFSNHESRSIDKEILFAPITPLKDFIEDLSQYAELIPKIKQIEQDIKDQQISNIFYLPESPLESIDYVVSLDQLAWLPAEEFQSYLEDIDINRKISLDLFGFYLFALKLSYHFCRLPEDSHRMDWSE